MIKDIRTKINVDKRGKITTGIKAISERTQKEYPKATDYFVIDDFPELKKSYGDKPKKLVLFFPSNEIIDFFDVNYVLYGNETKIRQCDGEECIHRIKETVAGKEYKAGEISECVCQNLPEDDKKICKPAMYLKAFIADKDTGAPIMPICYLFHSGSKNTAENLYSELTKIRNLAGGNLIGIPFGLSVEMVSGKEDAKQKFPIWSLQALGTVNQIRSAINGFLFNYREILGLTQGNTKLLEEGELTEDNPEYWRRQIKALKSLPELKKWKETYRRDIEMFPEDMLQTINEETDRKERELKGELI